MGPLTVYLAQLAASTDPRANLDRLAGLSGRLGQAATSAGAADRPGLLVLPEAFARDFGPPGSDVSDGAQPLDGPFVAALTTLAGTTGCTVVAGMFETSHDPARPYNTLVVVDAGGLRASYRKIHLYDSFGYRESDRLVAGDLTPVVLDVGGTAVGLMTCYDLRFPEMSRALVDAGAELLVVPAAWVAGERKVLHWRTLLLARAIENTCFVAAAAQPGPRYSGTSLVAAPTGEVLAELSQDEDGVLTGTVLDPDLLSGTRRANPSLGNRRM